MKIKVDGNELEVQEGSLLLAYLEAANVPTLCYHPQTETRGLCRLCSVEVEGKLLPACTTEVREGMEVQTNTERLRRLRQTLLEWLDLTTDLSLAEGLQELARELGINPSRWGEIPSPRRKREPIQDNPFFLRDYAKCISCRRCVDACGNGLMGVYALTMVDRGLSATVDTPLSLPLPQTPCVFCGNCVQVCPTGALRPLSLEV